MKHPFVRMIIESNVTTDETGCKTSFDQVTVERWVEGDLFSHKVYNCITGSTYERILNLGDLPNYVCLISICLTQTWRQITRIY